MKDELDKYLESADKEINRSRPKPKKADRVKSSSASRLKRWAASAAMDLFKLYIPAIGLIIFGGLSYLSNLAISIYFFLALIPLVIIALIFFLYDYHRFHSWTVNCSYKFEGWQEVISNTSHTFWDLSGEYWVRSEIIIVFMEPVNPKHVRVAEAFLKKLQVRLNAWTVSKETHFGYSQPSEWRQEDLMLTGDMNPRVLNLIRKAFSSEFQRLARLMPGAIDKVVLRYSGPEKYHQVYTDTSG